MINSDHRGSEPNAYIKQFAVGWSQVLRRWGRALSLGTPEEADIEARNRGANLGAGCLADVGRFIIQNDLLPPATCSRATGRFGEGGVLSSGPSCSGPEVGGLACKAWIQVVSFMISLQKTLTGSVMVVIAWKVLIASAGVTADRAWKYAREALLTVSWATKVLFMAASMPVSALSRILNWRAFAVKELYVLKHISCSGLVKVCWRSCGGGSGAECPGCWVTAGKHCVFLIDEQGRYWGHTD